MSRFVVQINSSLLNTRIVPFLHFLKTLYKDLEEPALKFKYTIIIGKHRVQTATIAI